MSTAQEKPVLLADSEREAMRDGARALRDAAQRINPNWGIEYVERYEQMSRNADKLEQLARWGL